MTSKKEYFRITFANGAAEERFDTYEECVAHLQAEIGDADDPDGPAIGHDGDIQSGGDRTMFWFNSAEAENDDGARALGSIVRVPIDRDAGGYPLSDKYDAI